MDFERINEVELVRLSPLSTCNNDFVERNGMERSELCERSGKERRSKKEFLHWDADLR